MSLHSRNTGSNSSLEHANASEDGDSISEANGSVNHVMHMGTNLTALQTILQSAQGHANTPSTLQD